MADTIQLRGLAWDHRRCWGPLDASVGPYCAAHPGLQIEWDRRSLWEFGEGKLDGPVADYDLIIYDHPFVGEAARDGMMVDLSTLLTADQVQAFATDALGPSWRSYRYGGGIWALPIDSAAQVAAYRPDLLARYAVGPPRSFDEVIGLGEKVRSGGQYIGWPSVPTDVMCTVLTVAAGLGYLPNQRAPFLAAAELSEVLTALRRLRAVAHPQSGNWNPIACFDHMSSTDDLVYVPYAFSYVNYAAPGSDRTVAFADIPSMRGSAIEGALLGGAGIGISARSPQVQAAFDYAMFLCSPEFQAGDYVRYGGQPGSLAAWTDRAADKAAGGFFSSTRQTMISAYLRPNSPGFIDFFRDAAQLASNHINDGTPSDDERLADQLNRRYEDKLTDAEHAA